MGGLITAHPSDQSLVSQPVVPPDPADSTSDLVPIKHFLTVKIDPIGQQIQVTDRLSISPANRLALSSQGLLLNAGLTVRDWKGGKLLGPETLESCGAVSCKRYRIRLDSGPMPNSDLIVRYDGPIIDESQPVRDQGVALTGASVWYPQLGGELVQFELSVRLPEQWKSVSQGERFHPSARGDEAAPTGSWSGWRTRQATDEIYLIAGPWFEYKRKMADGIQLYAFFRQKNQTLADSYLSTTDDYIQRYQALIGPYPYPKFAIAENDRQTGLGMPSFTLLGSKVLPLPFILHSSLPHEILHNWWGNGVFVDYEAGNWGEGLTTYLADYWIKEQQGEGLTYRRNALIAYADFVQKSNDLSLSQFRQRHNKSAQAVGYGKGAFFFHQLRQRLGDEVFLAGLRYFYQHFRFKKAGFAHLQQIMEMVSGQDLARFFEQWTQRSGAPSLELRQAQSEQQGDGGYKTTFTLVQSQDEEPYQLKIPLTITQVAEPVPLLFWQEMTQRQQSFSITTPLKPIRLDIDPSFDLFRSLKPQEHPITLSRAFAAERGLIIYPAQASKRSVGIFHQVAEAWNLGITPDDALSELPTQRAVWLFGRENRFEPELMRSLYHFDVGEGMQTKRIQVRSEWYDENKQGIVVVGNNPKDPESALVQVFVKSDKFPKLLPRLAKKLPHYGSYSYLVFSAQDGVNVAKGQWPAVGSELSATFDTQGQASPAKMAPVPRPVSPLKIPGFTAVHSDSQMIRPALIPEQLNPEPVLTEPEKRPPSSTEPEQSQGVLPGPSLVPLSTI
ncbi:MAG: M1 family peptidase [Magnetococcales bacterium]|nr:M1 family peptidase [Magnetococcales bacterium]